MILQIFLSNFLDRSKVYMTYMHVCIVHVKDIQTQFGLSSSIPTLIPALRLDMIVPKGKPSQREQVRVVCQKSAHKSVRLMTLRWLPSVSAVPLFANLTSFSHLEIITKLKITKMISFFLIKATIFNSNSSFRLQRHWDFCLPDLLSSRQSRWRNSSRIQIVFTFFSLLTKYLPL